jgi:hypothetical protein
MRDMAKAQEHLHKFLLGMPHDDGTKAKSMLYEMIRVVINEEREACAKVAETVSQNWSANNDEYKAVALMVAKEIRART